MSLLKLILGLEKQSAPSHVQISNEGVLSVRASAYFMNDDDANCSKSKKRPVPKTKKAE